MKQSKVPSYDFQINKEIPLLDIGEEVELAFLSTPLTIPEKPQKQNSVNRLLSPKVLEKLIKKPMFLGDFTI